MQHPARELEPFGSSPQYSAGKMCALRLSSLALCKHVSTRSFAVWSSPVSGSLISITDLLYSNHSRGRITSRFCHCFKNDAIFKAPSTMSYKSPPTTGRCPRNRRRAEGRRRSSPPPQPSCCTSEYISNVHYAVSVQSSGKAQKDSIHHARTALRSKRVNKGLILNVLPPEHHLSRVRSDKL